MTGFQEVEPASLEGLAKSGEVVLLDVRTAAEVSRGGIAGARHLPLHLLPVVEGELAVERHKTLVFYCQSGARSAQACAFMLSRGYERVYNLRGGFMGWMQSGKPAAQIALR